MSIETGGPAFPFSFHVGDEHRWAHGMALRDYFAAKVMQGLLAGGARGVDDLSHFAYEYADAMLKARDQNV